MLDTLPVFTDYNDFAWSPDSRSLVGTRVTSVDPEGESPAADIWLFEANGTKCQLMNTADAVESHARRIDSTRIVYKARPTLAHSDRTARLRVLTIRQTKPEEGR